MRLKRWGNIPMEPHIGRLAFNIAVLFILLTLTPLPFLEDESPEFTVDVMAAIISLTFLCFVVWDVKRQARREDTAIK